MNLFEFCQKKYSTGYRVGYDRYESTDKNVAYMLYEIYENFFKNSSRPSGKPAPSFEEVLSWDLSDNEIFSGSNPADMFALVFDVITGEIRNPLLWSDGAIGAKREISHLFTMCYHGREGHFIKSKKGLIFNKDVLYSEARKTLVDDMLGYNNLSRS